MHAIHHHAKGTPMKQFILYQDEFAERVVGHLVNDVHYCTSCGTGCNNCRLPYGSHARAIAGFEEITGDLPVIIDEPAEFLPARLPKVDILLPIGLHPDLLGGIPLLASESGIPAVLIPVEDKNWVPGGLEKQLASELDDLGIQHAFPRPFCALDVDPRDDSKSIIREYVLEFKTGRPEASLRIKNGKIMDGHVVRGQPCGCLYYIIQQLRGERVYDEAVTLDERISLAHHSFPCSASMENDPMLDDSPLHVGGYLARDAIHDAIERELGALDKSRVHKDVAIGQDA